MCDSINVFGVAFFMQLTELLSQVEFVMVPVANPDGYYVSEYPS